MCWWWIITENAWRSFLSWKYLTLKWKQLLHWRWNKYPCFCFFSVSRGWLFHYPAGNLHGEGMRSQEYCCLLWQLPLVGAILKYSRIVILCFLKVNFCRIQLLLSEQFNKLLPNMTSMMYVITYSHLSVKVWLSLSNWADWCCLKLFSPSICLVYCGW